MKTPAPQPDNVARAVENTRKRVLKDVELLERASVDGYFSNKPVSWSDFSVGNDREGCPFLHVRGILLDQLTKLEDRFSSGDEWGVSESIADLEWVYQTDVNAAILAKAEEVSR